MTTGFADLEAAFRAAEVETGEATPVDSEETMPVSEEQVSDDLEQADDGTVEQPDVAETTDTDVDDELQSLVDELAVDDEGTEGETPEGDPIAEFVASDDFWQTEVEVPVGDGTETRTLREMADGYLRQADYTKKTQQVAEQRKANEEAVEFHKAFSEDPLAFAYTLAVKASLIEQGDQPVKPIEVAKFQTPDEYEAELERRVEERFQSDERFTAMQQSEAQQSVNSMFEKLESERNVKLSAEVRKHLIDLALETGTSDLTQVFDAEMYRKQLARQRANEQARKAPSRPTRSSGGVEPRQKDDMVADIDDAFQRALAEVGEA